MAVGSFSDSPLSESIPTWFLLFSCASILCFPAPWLLGLEETETSMELYWLVAFLSHYFAALSDIGLQESAAGLRMYRLVALSVFCGPVAVGRVVSPLEQY